MTKFEPLQRYLESLHCESWDARFSDIERILGADLPPSAYRHNAWWANETSRPMNHKASWQEAGWRTRNVNLRQRSVRFERLEAAARVSARVLANPAAALAQETANTDVNLDALAQLLDRAAKILKIADHTEVMRLALESLIQRSVSRELANFGGSMPDLQVPDRERPAA